MAIGRPSIRTDEMVDDIVQKVSDGTPLAQVCRLPGMPHPSTFHDWRRADEALSLRFAQARDDGYDMIALQALAIADGTENDTIMTDDGREIPNHEWISRSRLRVDTRLKLLAKWDPSRYGDKIHQEHSGGVTITTSRLDDEL